MGKYKEESRGRHGVPTQLPEVVAPTEAVTPPTVLASAPPPVSAGSVPTVPAASSEPGMSWPLAFVVTALVVSGFGFAFAMIAVVGMDPWMATVITMAIVSVIVSALIPRRGESGMWRRIANAIHALGGGDGTGGSGDAR